MGWRAIRMMLDRPAILRVQLRALLAAAGGRNLSLMFPMVAEVAELGGCTPAARPRDPSAPGAPAGRSPAGLEVGVMLEVPALFWQLPALLPRVDFVSIGSNDLLQFLFACDRGNPALVDRYDALSPPALSLLRDLVERAPVPPVCASASAARWRAGRWRPWRSVGPGRAESLGLAQRGRAGEGHDPQPGGDASQPLRGLAPRSPRPQPPRPAPGLCQGPWRGVADERLSAIIGEAFWALSRETGLEDFRSGHLLSKDGSSLCPSPAVGGATEPPMLKTRPKLPVEAQDRSLEVARDIGRRLREARTSRSETLNSVADQLQDPPGLYRGAGGGRAWPHSGPDLRGRLPCAATAPIWGSTARSWSPPSSPRPLASPPRPSWSTASRSPNRAAARR